ncbi:hypothetical protein D1B33_04805 [Lysinibacillus yapensis]|uniref:Uncharacterized protein n=1 Tax=Ureibacillus yapensis TaxID=2304605 RepID=A0A396SA60_9BACL|nr:hypothetical protein D1B33_04805 [Lysinibacillus yapensis]
MFTHQNRLRKILLPRLYIEKEMEYRRKLRNISTDYIVKKVFPNGPIQTYPDVLQYMLSGEMKLFVKRTLTNYIDFGQPYIEIQAMGSKLNSIQ